MPTSYSEARFREKVNQALKAVRTVLDNTRHPTFAADVQHEYVDKYVLAEFLTNATLAAQLHCLEKIGLSDKVIEEVRKLAGKRSVTLRLTAEEKCAFDREVTRKVESKTEHVREYKGAFGKSTRTDKTVTKVTEYFWRYDVHWQLYVFAGNSPEKKVELQSRKCNYEIMTSTKTTPRPKVAVLPSVDLNVTYWLSELEKGKGKIGFRINREVESCRTPRRNEDVQGALAAGGRLYDWCGRVNGYFTGRLFPVETGHGLDLAGINASGLFVPAQPLMEALLGEEGAAPAAAKKGEEDKAGKAGEDGGSGVVPLHDLPKFMEEQARSLEERVKKMDKLFPAPDKGKLISSQEARVVVSLLLNRDVCQHYSDGVDYIEDMLRKQLIAAIGKIVGPVDFANFMEYHYRKLYRGEFEPRLFSYAIRRPDHYPEGVVSIEGQLADGSLSQPIRTVVRRREATSPMRFAINAATDVQFFGDRYLHAWMQHQFSGQSGVQLSLIARARQFSSFILLVGRISSAEVFDPKAALIIQNKDDLKLPLMLETIPSAKEFKDAISSLSPEQQRFAKAFRGMQLESTLFGICVIQIKPQLEKLLNLPNDGLTKEIKLTQNLMELFIKYQIPSDLLSFAGSEHTSLEGKLQTVKGYVQAMYDMINECKQKELEEKKQEAEYARQKRIQDNTPVLSGVLARSTSTARSGGGGGGRGFRSKGAPRRDMKMRSRRREMAPMRSAAPVGAVAPAPVNKPSPAPASKPTPPVNDTTSSTPVEEPKGSAEVDAPEDAVEGVVDYTQVPQKLESQFERLDKEGALRPTIINPGKQWRKKAQKALLAKPTESTLGTDEQKVERNQAFDLLDALSRSGALTVDQASLHVVVAATHCFDKTLVETVVQDNVNPIEKVERSSLIMASVVQEAEPSALIKPSQLERVRTYSPMLFEDSS